MPISQTITDSHVWKKTLEARSNDDAEEARERLRSAFAGVRERAGLLAGEIRRDLPQLTLHDQSHLDALWETAATILGPDYALTPTEGFVLGGAFLLHDLGMALPSVEGGLDGLKKDPRWADLVTYEYQSCHDRTPSIEEIDAPEDPIRKRVLLNLLQQTHAANAERLAFLNFSSEESDDVLHLIEDSEVRQTFGRLIGQVSHSHWWSIGELERSFQRTIGAPHWCPREWTIDPLKIACVLRCADAAQIDARRAPQFLSAMSDLDETSANHWVFQKKLNKPYLEEDSLIFTTGQSFSMKEAPAWWVCLETLRMVDVELRGIDALFADKGLPRFSARRVAGIENPQRLVSYIQTNGWIPIDAIVHVTDLPRLITSVGGEELYGRNPEVAIRELVQNSSDAIRARRVYEGRDSTYGSVKVSLSSSDDGHWLEVLDNGVGMSQPVLTGFLLDFGRSFWGSPDMQREFPGLLSSGIRQAGKYGIGFFSAFMLADEVQVFSRRSDAAAKDTLILEFSSGVQGRPILREACAREQLVDGGTLVRLKLKNNPFESGGLLWRSSGEKNRTLASICEELCPTLDVDLHIEEDRSTQIVVGGGDWNTMDAYEFLKRLPIVDHDKSLSDEELDLFRRKAAGNLRPLRNKDGSNVGRALVTVGYATRGRHEADLSGVVTVGGLTACGLSGIAGALVGVPMRASRDVAKPIVEDEELRRWATEQADLIPALWEDSNCQAACATYIRLLGGDTRDLPICQLQGEWKSAATIRNIDDLPNQIIFVDRFTVDYTLKHVNDYSLSDSVFVVEHSGYPGLLQSGSHREVRWPGHMNTNYSSELRFFGNTLGGAVLEAIAAAWGVELDVILSSNSVDKESNVKIGTSPTGDLVDQAILITRPGWESMTQGTEKGD
jgi:hypothetical protein